MEIEGQNWASIAQADLVVVVSQKAGRELRVGVEWLLARILSCSVEWEIGSSWS
jgi:hypothetical protein